jgi:hypothetical protein
MVASASRRHPRGWGIGTPAALPLTLGLCRGCDSQRDRLGVQLGGDSRLPAAQGANGRRRPALQVGSR